jgi:hypothetical protein
MIIDMYLRIKMVFPCLSASTAVMLQWYLHEQDDMTKLTQQPTRYPVGL